MPTATAAAGAGLWTETWPALGSTAVLRCAPSPAPADERAPGVRTSAARAAVQRELRAIDEAASRFRPDSELSRVNAAAGREVRVGALLFEAISVAVWAAELTDGAVDPDLGAELVAAGLHRDICDLHPVAPGEPLHPGTRLRMRRRRRARPAWPAIELGSDPPTVRLPHGASLDLGATAKALAADRAAAAAHAASGGGVLVSLGGDIATCGNAPEGGWRIHVTDDHRSGPTAPGQTISIDSGAIATSSLVTRRWRHRGRAMHHILDPRTGEPVTPVWQTVSVAAASCVEANIAATAAIVLGHDAPAWLAGHGLPARLVAVDGEAQIQGGWPA
ncbi:MAG: FAD:protein FMN transferase [Solirubrobacteraceae bacterium]